MTNFTLKQIPLDTKEISPSLLNIENKERSNLLAWSGQFSPQFVEAILKRYAGSNARVYDPFCGSGTVLYECGRFGMSATGIELNPAAYILARTYKFINLHKEPRAEVITKLDLALREVGCDAGILDKNSEEVNIEKDLLTLVASLTGFERQLAESLIILSDFYKGATRGRVKRTWWRLKSIVETLPYSFAPLDIELRDCREESTPSEVFNFVLTSPPYINVYNYHQQYRRSTESLGWDLLDVAKSEIGSNRKNRANRFITVIQYCLDMAQLLRVLRKITSQDARFVFVVGRESNVRGVPFLNGELFAKVAVSAMGYNLLTRQERVFGNRFGQQIYEDIIHLEKSDATNANSEEIVRGIARDALKAVSDPSLKIDVRSDIDDALSRIDNTHASPIYKRMEQ
jgi:SAM-dependent methyltransferase